MIVAFTVASLAVRTRQPDRLANAVWVWEYSEPRRLVEVADDLAAGRLLVWVSPGFSADAETLDYLDRLRKQAAGSHIAVDALGGDPQWALRPELADAWAAEV
ncbi:MAG: hypothetical protein LBU50_03515, partial [Cellulomonas sp.]|nr:hypothetical protein [Cellulomonas sp.]